MFALLNRQLYIQLEGKFKSSAYCTRWPTKICDNVDELVSHLLKQKGLFYPGYQEISAGLQTQISFSDVFAVKELLAGTVQRYPAVLQNAGAVGSFQSMFHVLLNKQDGNTLVA